MVRVFRFQGAQRGEWQNGWWTVRSLHRGSHTAAMRRERRKQSGDMRSLNRRHIGKRNQHTSAVKMVQRGDAGGERMSLPCMRVHRLHDAEPGISGTKAARSCHEHMVGKPYPPEQIRRMVTHPLASEHRLQLRRRAETFGTPSSEHKTAETARTFHTPHSKSARNRARGW